MLVLRVTNAEDITNSSSIDSLYKLYVSISGLELYPPPEETADKNAIEYKFKDCFVVI
jgi:hypothetical protein